MRGSWGYVFRNEMGKLHLYQSKVSDGEKEVQADPYTAVLSSTDWAVLRLFWLEYLKGDYRSPAVEEDDGMEEEGASGSFPDIGPMLSAEKILFSAVWLSKTNQTGRWFFRACVRVAGENDIVYAEYFTLESFHSECGVFRPVLNLPALCWSDLMVDKDEKISALFHSCIN